MPGLLPGILAALLTLLAWLAAPHAAWAVSAPPTFHTLGDPSGGTVEARQRGDEFGHWWEDREGRPLGQDAASGGWLRMEGASAGRAGANLGGRGRMSARRLFTSSLGPEDFNIPVLLANYPGASPLYGGADMEALLFADGTGSMRDYFEEVSYGALVVSSGPSGVGGWYTASRPSVYYGSNVSGYDAHPAELVRDVLGQADRAGFDFSRYDLDGDCMAEGVIVVFQGQGEESTGESDLIWAHSWTLAEAALYGDGEGPYETSSPCPSSSTGGTDGARIVVDAYTLQPELHYDGALNTMGVFAHEFGHVLGLPDLYDTDYSSEGVGPWGLMGSGSWGRVIRDGDSPVHMTAWSKLYLGWITPRLVTDTMTDEGIEAAYRAPDVYQFLPGGPHEGGEYFLIENRYPGGFDMPLDMLSAGGGLLIWHIDESAAGTYNPYTSEYFGPNDNECAPLADGPDCASAHYKVSLVQADGLYGLETFASDYAGDPYKGGVGAAPSFSPEGEPSSDLYMGIPSGASVTGPSGPGVVMTATLSPGVAGNTPPVAPVIIRPEGGSAGHGDSVEIVWEPSADSDGDTVTYFVRYAKNPFFVGAVTVKAGESSRGGAVLVGSALGAPGLMVFAWLLPGGAARRRALAMALALMGMAGLMACGIGGGDGGDGLSHTLTGLDSSSTYYAKVIATDMRGGISESAVNSFTTAYEPQDVIIVY